MNKKSNKEIDIFSYGNTQYNYGKDSIVWLILIAFFLVSVIRLVISLIYAKTNISHIIDLMITSALVIIYTKINADHIKIINKFEDNIEK